MSYLMKCQAGQIYHKIDKVLSPLSLNRQFYWPFLSEAEILQKNCKNIFSDGLPFPCLEAEISTLKYYRNIAEI